MICISLWLSVSGVMTNSDKKFVFMYLYHEHNLEKLKN